MWDLKLNTIDLIFPLSILFLELFNKFSDIFIFLYFNKSISFYVFNFFNFVRNNTFMFITKFLLSIMFLILIRGGTPRYRYDYLTKLGWLKFLGLIIVFFVILVFFYFLL